MISTIIEVTDVKEEEDTKNMDLRRLREGTETKPSKGRLEKVLESNRKIEHWYFQLYYTSFNFLLNTKPTSLFSLYVTLYVVGYLGPVKLHW